MRLLSLSGRSASQHAERDGSRHGIRRLAVPGLRPYRHVFRIQTQQLADVDERVVAGRRVDVGNLLTVRVYRVTGYGGAREVRSR